MKFRFLAISTLIILAQPVAKAAVRDACANVDVRESLPADVKTFMSTPASQGDIGWCFGWVTADLLSQTMGTPVSALHISSYYSSTVTPLGKLGRQFVGKQDIPEGGDIASAIKDINNLGYVCREKNLPSKGSQSLWLKDGTYVAGGVKALIAKMKAYKENRCDRMCETSLDGLISAFIPRVSPETVKDYLRTYPRVHLENTLFVFLNSTCQKNSLSLNNKKIEYGVTHKNISRDELSRYTPMTDAIDYALNLKRLVGLEYDSALISPSDSFFGNGHASTIVARKRLGGQCYYLVRNTWGSKCPYLPGVLCVKDQGSYWVKKEIMERMATKVTWVKNNLPEHKK